MSDTARDEPRFWNVWWTLAVISAAITFLAGLLEALGVWHDLGLGVGVMGTVATIVFGGVGATQSTVRNIQRRLDAMQDTLGHILLVLNQIRDRLTP